MGGGGISAAFCVHTFTREVMNMIRPMTHRQQLLLASGCGLLFLLAMLLVWMFMLQKEPEEPGGLPAETTAVSNYTDVQ